jgi:thiol-disulfide isomerase/thioredoxin
MKRPCYSVIALALTCFLFTLLPFRPGTAARGQSQGIRPGARAPAFIGSAEDWLNTDGKPVQWKPGDVILVDFWEYTCVNCIRTLPYLKAWYARYAKDGLVIVGIHTPEFAFARERANVAAAVKRFGLTYPILVDSDYKNWFAWQGEQGYWPRKFLVDFRGNVVYDHAGEGGYGDTEAKIQALLKEAHPGIKLPPLMEAVRAEDRPGAVCYPVTPEMYAGQRGFNAGQHGSVSEFLPGRITAYRFAGAREDGKFYLQGAWRTDRESLRHARETRGLPDFVAIKYHALSCNAVIKPEDGRPFRLYVTQDGRPVPKTDAGEDIRYDEAGRSYAPVDAPRMYRLTRHSRFGSHVLKLAADSAGFGLYSFTFTSCVQPQ